MIPVASATRSRDVEEANPSTPEIDEPEEDEVEPQTDAPEVIDFVPLAEEDVAAK